MTSRRIMSAIYSELSRWGYDVTPDIAGKLFVAGGEPDRITQISQSATPAPLAVEAKEKP